jgi:hypothetical protein
MGAGEEKERAYKLSSGPNVEIRQHVLQPRLFGQVLKCMHIPPPGLFCLQIHVWPWPHFIQAQKDLNVLSTEASPAHLLHRGCAHSRHLSLSVPLPCFGFTFKTLIIA